MEEKTKCREKWEMRGTQWHCTRDAVIGAYCRQHHADRRKNAIEAAERALLDAAEKWREVKSLEPMGAFELVKAVDALRKAREM